MTSLIKHLESADFHIRLARACASRGLDVVSHSTHPLPWALRQLRVALAIANREAKHLRGAIMRAMNYVRALIRSLAR